MKLCQFLLDVPEGYGYGARSEYREDVCCGKPARALAWGWCPVCAEHFDIIEAVDREKGRT